MEGTCVNEICKLTKVDQKEVSNLKMYHCNYLLLPHLHLLCEAKTECPLILFMEMITVSEWYVLSKPEFSNIDITGSKNPTCLALSFTCKERFCPVFQGNCRAIVIHSSLAGCALIHLYHFWALIVLLIMKNWCLEITQRQRWEEPRPTRPAIHRYAAQYITCLPVIK